MLFWRMCVVREVIGVGECSFQRAVGDRSYKALWRRYRSRVMIAMSSQAFAQLVSGVAVPLGLSADARTVSTVCRFGWQRVR